MGFNSGFKGLNISTYIDFYATITGSMAAALSHCKPASTLIPRDNCALQGSDRKKTRCTMSNNKYSNRSLFQNVQNGSGIHTDSCLVVQWTAVLNNKYLSKVRIIFGAFVQAYVSGNLEKISKIAVYWDMTTPCTSENSNILIQRVGVCIAHLTQRNNPGKKINIFHYVHYNIVYPYLQSHTTNCLRSFVVGNQLLLRISVTIRSVIQEYEYKQKLSAMIQEISNLLL